MKIQFYSSHLRGLLMFLKIAQKSYSIHLSFKKRSININTFLSEMVRILNVEEFFFSLGFIILLGSEIRVSYDSTYFVVPVFCAVKLFLAVSCRFFAANSFPPVVLFVHKQTFSF